MRVEVVHHQHDPLGLGVLPIDQIVDEPSPILTLSLLGHFKVAPARQGLEGEKQVGHSLAAVLVIFALDTTRTSTERLAFVLQQLFARLVHTDHRPLSIVWTLVDVQDVFHPIDELAVRLRGNAPTLLQMGLELVFFSVRRTVS
jgi:hypothetical protein